MQKTSSHSRLTKFIRRLVWNFPNAEIVLEISKHTHVISVTYSWPWQLVSTFVSLTGNEIATIWSRRIRCSSKIDRFPLLPRPTDIKTRRIASFQSFVLASRLRESRRRDKKATRTFLLAVPRWLRADYVDKYDFTSYHDRRFTVLYFPERYQATTTTYKIFLNISSRRTSCLELIRQRVKQCLTFPVVRDKSLFFIEFETAGERFAFQSEEEDWRLTPCHTNCFPENVPVLTIQFYSTSVHVLIKEKTKIFFLFLCVVDGKSHLHSRG